MGQMKKKEMPLWARTGHSKPVTRREFFSAGLIPFFASALVPGALGLLSGMGAEANALTCPSADTGFCPFITVNLGGGAGLAANFIPRAADGSLLPSYSLLGSGTTPALVTDNTAFGYNLFHVNSGMLAGMNSVPNVAAALANTQVVSIPVQSRDDNSANAFDASGLVFKAGLHGGYLPNLGTSQGTTGIGQNPSAVTPPPPLIVGNFNDLANSIGYTAALKSSLNKSQQSSLTKLVNSLNASQTKKLASIRTIAQVQDLVQCAGVTNLQLMALGTNAIDPLADGSVASSIQSIWNINSGTSANNQDRVFSSMVYNAMKGQAGSVGLNMGGYDYHDNTRTTGDSMDNKAGQVIGKILATAASMGKPVFIYVCSDGAVVSQDSMSGGSPWTSDRGTGGMAMFFVYSPTAKPKVSSNQIGQFTSGQVADDSYITGADPALAAQAAFANYLQFNGKIALFDSTVGRSALSGNSAGVIRIG